jgi:hypothetical protein
VAGRVVVFGELNDRYEAERLLNERHPDMHVETVGHGWEMVDRVMAERFDAALILKGPIAAHQHRLDTVAGLRRNAFSGRILVAGAFLTEKQDAIRAGADYAFDPDKQATEQVVSAALYRPLLAADHPYLRYLFLGEWAELAGYGDTLPSPAPPLLLVATSCHADAAFYSSLAAMVRSNPTMRCILVEDDGGEEARTEALATGVQPYVTLAEEGLQQVLSLGKRFLGERWLARVAAA